MSWLRDLLSPSRWPSLLAAPASSDAADAPEAPPPPPPPPPEAQKPLIRHPEEDEEPAPLPYPVALSGVQELQLYSFTGWRSENVRAALAGFETGAMAQPHLLFLAMLRDPVFAHGIETRVIGQIACDFEWKKHPDLPQALFDEWNDRWPDVFDENELASSTRMRIGLGVVPAHVRWTADSDGNWWPRRVETKDTGNLTWFPTERRYKIVTLYDGQLTVDDDACPWVLFKERASSYSHLHGAARSLAELWYLKGEATQLRSNYGRFCGVPIRKASTPVEQRAPTAGAPDVKAFLRRAQQLLGNGVFQALKFPPNWETVWDLEFLEAEGKAYEVFTAIIKAADEAITLRLLGATDNTRGGDQGSRARAEVHERVSNRYLGADCKLTARVFSRLARLWCSFNKIPRRLAPIPCFHYELPPDERADAEARERNAAALERLVASLPTLEQRLVAQDPAARVDYRALLLAHKLPLLEPGERRSLAPHLAPSAGGDELPG